MPRTIGYIVTYKRDRGFGFIDSPSYPEQQVFFHFRAIIDFETNELSSQLDQAASENIFPPIEVSFNPVRTEKGIEAHHIQPTDFERAQETYYKIKQFLQTADFSPENFEDSFIRHVTLKIISSFGQDASLKSIAINKLINSSEKWDDIVTLAQEWEEARRNLKKTAIFSGKDQLSKFSHHLINLLGFRPLTGFTNNDIDAHTPFFRVRVHPLNTPFEALYQARNWSFIFLPDDETLIDMIRTRPHLLAYDETDMKIIVLLDEDRNAKITNSNIALLSQTEILRILVKGEKDILYQQGRILRSILPKSKLQPYDAGVAYSERMFSGRRTEGDLILSSASNYAVYGGRRIGKTWFLQDIVWKCQQPPYDQIYLPLYVSLQPARSSQQAINYIQEAIDFRYGVEQYQGAYTFQLLRNRFLKLHQLHNKVILLALDEVDRLVRAKTNGQRFFEELRAFQSTYPETIKIVFAGFKELIGSFSKLTYNYPLGNWVRRKFSLGCLSKDDLRDLVLRLKWVGITFNPDDILGKVYDLTSGHPYYAHILCESIADAIVNQNLKTLSPSDVDKYVTTQFFGVVFRTFTKNLNPLQRLIGKMFSDNKNGFSEQDIGRLLRDRYQIEVEDEQLNEEMGILVACSVFAYENQGYIPVMYEINKAYFGTLNEEDLALKVIVGEKEDDDNDDNEDGDINNLDGER